jgi:hypothetical protein
VRVRAFVGFQDAAVTSRHCPVRSVRIVTTRWLSLLRLPPSTVLQALESHVFKLTLAQGWGRGHQRKLARDHGRFFGRPADSGSAGALMPAEPCFYPHQLPQLRRIGRPCLGSPMARVPETTLSLACLSAHPCRCAGRNAPHPHTSRPTETALLSSGTGMLNVRSVQWRCRQADARPLLLLLRGRQPEASLREPEGA